MTKSYKCLGRSVLLISCALGTADASFAVTPGGDEIKVVLQNLVEYAEDGHQSKARDAWEEIVEAAGAEHLPLILTAMGDQDSLTGPKDSQTVGPLTENWLRAAADAVAERELAKSGTLPAAELEKFVLDPKQSPRGRRVAYEWLLKVDSDAPSRLLPNMLDDPSLELRYDAVAKLLAEAKGSTEEKLKLEKYQRALRSARDKAQLKECAEALKELGQTTNMAKQIGFLTNWHVSGPFDNTDRAGFGKVYPPELGVNVDTELMGRDGAMSWKEAVAEQEDLEKLGLVDLNEALVEEKSVVGYAVTTFVSKKPQQVECRYESKEATKLWVNGEEVAVKNVYHSGGGFDQYIVPCQLKAGPNQILIKVCQNEQTEPWTKPWDFRLRITDSLGGAIPSAK